MDRVCCCEWNRTLSDEGESHDEVGRTGFSFFFCKFIFEQQGCKCNRTRRNHTADHNGCHNVVVSCCDGCCSEYVSCFVERAAHVDGHHAAEDHAKDQLAGSAHGSKTIVQYRVDGSHDRLYNEEHQKSHRKDADYRVNQNRRNLFECFRKFLTCFAEAKDNVACCKTGNECSKETGGSARCHHTADKTKGKCRPVADCHGDVACKNREHEAECHAADLFEHRCSRGNRTEV